MIQHKRAFTLIELLVVVLIIGILASVALPQYQKAVVKSRFSELIQAGDALYKASIIYRLANGSWPDTLEQLDIDLFGTISENKISIENENYRCDLKLNDEARSILCHPRQYMSKIDFRIYASGVKVCEALNTEPSMISVCQTFGPKTVSGGGGANRRYAYKIN